MKRPNVSGIMDRVFSSLASGSVAFLCGAGISLDGGFPTAKEFKDKVCSAISPGLSAKAQRAIACLPMELLLENLSRFVQIETLLDTFDDGTPASTHRILGRICQRGLCRCIATTNIDCLFEAAFERERVPVRTFTSPMFEKGQFGIHVSLLKLHGSVENKASVMMTIKSVAKQSVLTPTTEMLRHLFQSGDHDLVIILGYSCSDELDVNPFLRSLAGRNTKEIIYVSHDSGRALRHAISGALPLLFKGYVGANLVIDTEKFVGEIAHQLDLGNIGPVKRSKAWVQRVQTWAHAVRSSACKCDLAIGRAIYSGSEYDLAEQEFASALHSSRIFLERIWAWYWLAQCAVAKGELGKSLLLGHQMIGFVESNGRQRTVRNLDLTEANARSYYIVGLTEYDLGERQTGPERLVHFRRAHQAFVQMATHLNSRELLDLEIGYNLMMGVILREMPCSARRRQVGLRRSLQYLNRASLLCKETGDVIQEADALFDIAVTYFKQRRFHSAQVEFLKVLATFQYLGDQDAMARSMIALADSIQRGQPRSIIHLQIAAVFYGVSIKIKKALGISVSKNNIIAVATLRRRLRSLGVGSSRPAPLQSVALAGANTRQLAEAANGALKYFRSSLAK